MDTCKIIIGLGTCNRPVMLTRCLNALKTIEVPDNILIILIVVDNDKSGSAKEIFDHHSSSIPFKSRFFIEETKGIVFTRNRILNEGASFYPHYFCFVDDDEEVYPDWLINHLEGIKKYQADVTAGSVERKFEGSVPLWISKGTFFSKSHHKTGSVRKSASTANVMFDSKLYFEFGLRFNERLNMTGSSDALFFEQAYRYGAKIVWIEEARVLETLPQSRLKLRWLLKRHFREANTEILKKRIMKDGLISYADQIYLIASDLLDAIVLAPLRLFSGRYHIIKSLVSLFRFFGRVIGLIGIHYNEYKTIHGS